MKNLVTGAFMTTCTKSGTKVFSTCHDMYGEGKVSSKVITQRYVSRDETHT